MEILVILACVPLYVINSFCDKQASQKNVNGFFYNCVKFLACGIIVFPMLLTDSEPRFKLGTMICGVVCGIMYAVSKMLMLKGYEITSVAFMTLCHASGMIIPCVIGHFFWSESLGVWSIIGIILAISSICLLKDTKSEKKSLDTQGILIGAIIFLTSGGVMITQKVMGIYFTEQSVSAYNFYSFAVAFLLMSMLLRTKKINKESIKPALLCALGSAVSLCVISLVMTSLARSVPSVILFPLFNGLGIIFVCIGSIPVFKEKFTLKKSIGLVVGVIGLCLVNL